MHSGRDLGARACRPLGVIDREAIVPGSGHPTRSPRPSSSRERRSSTLIGRKRVQGNGENAIAGVELNTRRFHHTLDSPDRFAIGASRTIAPLDSLDRGDMHARTFRELPRRPAEKGACRPHLSRCQHRPAPRNPSNKCKIEVNMQILA